MLTKSRLIQLLSMLSLLIGLFVWRTVEISTQENVNISDELSILDESLCDFSVPCEVETEQGSFYLSVDQGEIIPENWFNLTLTSNVDNWQVIEAKTVGKTMFMGKIPLTFSPVEKGRSQTRSMLGVCTEDRMVWRFDIVVDIDGQPLQLFYDFVITH